MNNAIAWKFTYEGKRPKLYGISWDLWTILSIRRKGKKRSGSFATEQQWVSKYLVPRFKPTALQLPLEIIRRVIRAASATAVEVVAAAESPEEVLLVLADGGHHPGQGQLAGHRRHLAEVEPRIESRRCQEQRVERRLRGWLQSSELLCRKLLQWSSYRHYSFHY